MFSQPKKQTQFKPNFFKGQNELKITCRKIRPHPNRGSNQFLEKAWYRNIDAMDIPLV